MDQRLAAIPKAPNPGPVLATFLALALYRAGGTVILGSGIKVVAADTQGDAPAGLGAGTVVVGLDGTLGQVNSSGTLVTLPSAAAAVTWALLQTFTTGLLIQDSGALKFGTPGTDVVFTSDGTDVDVTGTGKLDMRDDVAHFVDPAAPTKRVRLDAGAVTAGQTRVLASPDSDGTLALLGLAQTFTAKQTFGAVRLGGIVDSPMEAAQVLTNGATITAPTGGDFKAVSSASAVTGIIMEAGTVAGQVAEITNSNASDSITFDATPATSRVAMAVCVIPAGGLRRFRWNPTTSRWTPTG